MNKENIITELRQKTGNNRIQLPQDVNFNIKDRTLTITLSDAGVVANMQDNNSAFEGWAICLKYWLKDYIDTIVIDWNTRIELSNQNIRQHYERFKYRIHKFTKTYAWAHTKNYCANFYEEKMKNWVINYPTQNADPNANNEEAILERNYIEMHKDCYDSINQQLPVGIFDEIICNSNSIMPGGKGQIDIWAISNKTLHIFELKVDGNEKIGIISELMFYVNIMFDVMSHKIKYPKEAENANFRSFEFLYDAYKKKNIQKIQACFLTKKLHPLITNEVIKEMNDFYSLNLPTIKYLHLPTIKYLHLSL